MCEYYTRHVNTAESARADSIKGYISSDNDAMLLQSRKRDADEMHKLLIKKSKTIQENLRLLFALKKPGCFDSERIDIGAKNNVHKIALLYYILQKQHQKNAEGKRCYRVY